MRKLSPATASRHGQALDCIDTFIVADVDPGVVLDSVMSSMRTCGTWCSDEAGAKPPDPAPVEDRSIEGYSPAPTLSKKHRCVY